MSEIEIEELREAGEDGGDLMGYYCRGHVDAHAFAQAANHYSGALDSYDIRHARADNVRHVWWRTVPIAGEPGQSAYHQAEPKSSGAWPATVCTSVEDRERGRANRFVEEWRKGREHGFCEGLNWALRALDTINPEAGETLLKRYREHRP